MPPGLKPKGKMGARRWHIAKRKTEYGYTSYSGVLYCACPCSRRNQCRNNEGEANTAVETVIRSCVARVTPVEDEGLNSSTTPVTRRAFGSKEGHSGTPVRVRRPLPCRCRSITYGQSQSFTTEFRLSRWDRSHCTLPGGDPRAFATANKAKTNSKKLRRDKKRA